MGNGSIISVHISGGPLEGILRVGEGLQEQLKNQPCNVYFYRQISGYVGKFQNADFLQHLHVYCLEGKAI